MNKSQNHILQDNLDYTLFSWSKQSGISPLNIERTKGVYLYDYDGKKYLDFSSGLMNVNIGHGDQRVTDAVVKQMQQVGYVTPGCATEARGKLGKKLSEICPGDLNKTFFTTCGATAIENAIKLARLYTGRSKVIGKYRSYHGATYGAMSVGGDPRKLPSDFQQAPNFVHIEDPYCYRCPWSKSPDSCSKECVSHLERVMHFEGPENIAAIVLEGESGSSGCIKYPKDYWPRVREICDKHDILLISDEVMSGFGRTGEWFGVNHFDVVPDMIVMAKGITAGYLPLGALTVSDKITSKYDDTPLWIGLTYSAHPVACAAALAVIKIYEKDELFTKANSMGQYLEERMSALSQQHISIGDFRNTGLLGCIELVRNRETKEPTAPFNAKPDEMILMNQVAAKIRELGMFTFVRWNFIFVAPPLNISKAEMDEGLSIISEALKITDQAYES